VRALFGDADALPRIVAGWDKRYLDLTRPGYRFGAPAPLGAIYVLGERLPGAAAPEIVATRGATALKSLLAHTYAHDLLAAAQLARELDGLGRLGTHVPVRLVRAPDGTARAGDVCDAILSDFRGAAA
jgi:hypothetical protein